MGLDAPSVTAWPDLAKVLRFNCAGLNLVQRLRCHLIVRCCIKTLGPSGVDGDLSLFSVQSRSYHACSLCDGGV